MDIFWYFMIALRVLIGVNRIESFRLEYKYEIEYEYNLRISNQLRSQGPHFSLLLISRDKGFRNKIGVLFDDLEYSFLL